MEFAMRRHAIFLTTIASSVAAPTYTISGTVYDADGSTAVAGATITLGALTATSAANGTYSFTGLAAGTSGSMTCTKTGYSWSAITVASMTGNLTTQNYTNRWWAALGIAGSCVGAYQAKNAASQADSYVNQKTPGTYDLVASVAPDWAIGSGWAFNGSSHYLRTGIVPVKQLWTVIVRYTGLTQAANKDIFGCRNTLPSFRIETTAGPGFLYYSGNTINITRTAAAGSIAIAGNQGYFNGAAEEGTMDDLGTDLGTRDIYIGCANLDGSPDRYASVTIESVAIYNATLTQPQIDAVGDATLNFT